MNKTKTNVELRNVIATLIFSAAFIAREAFNGGVVPWYAAYMVGVLVVFSRLKYDIYMEDLTTIKTIFTIFTVPYLGAILYTVLGSLFNEQFRFTMLRSVSTTCRYASIILIATIAFFALEDNCMDIVENSIIICYSYYFIRAVLAYGVKGILEYIIDPVYHQMIYSRRGIDFLERHDLGAAIGIVLLHIIFCKKEKLITIKTILLCLIFYLCYKRIEIFGFTIAFLFGIILKKHDRSKRIIVNTALSIILLWCVIYVVLIASGKLNAIASFFHINLVGRIGIFNSVRRFYYLSLFYPGCGFGFTGKYLSSIVGSDYAWKIGSKWMSSIHNNILQIYIELGAIGGFIWFFYSIIMIPNMIGKIFGEKARNTYCIFLIYTYISYSLDAVMDYYSFQFCFFLVLLTICFCDRKRHIVDDAELYQNKERGSA